MISKFDLKGKGGEWLGAARNWIKWNCLNGDTVTWGSTEVLNTRFGGITVQQIEDLASEVAAAAINEHEKCKLSQERMQEIFNGILNKKEK